MEQPFEPADQLSLRDPQLPSLGISSSANGSDSRSSSSTSSGASPSSSSLIELVWICLSLARLFSSSGAALTSSSSCLIMLPTRMTLAGCSTISVTGRSPPTSSASVSTATPSGPTTTIFAGVCGSGALSSAHAPNLVRRARGLGASPGRDGSRPEQNFPDVPVGFHQLVRLRGFGERQHGVDDRLDLARGDQRPDQVGDPGDDLGLLVRRAGPAARSPARWPACAAARRGSSSALAPPCRPMTASRPSGRQRGHVALAGRRHP